MALPTVLAAIQPSAVEAVADDERNMEYRALRLDHVMLANQDRRAGRALQYIGVRDNSPQTHQLGVELEARANRALRQVGAR